MPNSASKAFSASPKPPVFLLRGYHFDCHRGRATFYYRLKKSRHFTEKIDFTLPADTTISQAQRKILHRLFLLAAESLSVPYRAAALGLNSAPVETDTDSGLAPLPYDGAGTLVLCAAPAPTESASATPNPTSAESTPITSNPASAEPTLTTPRNPITTPANPAISILEAAKQPFRPLFIFTDLDDRSRRARPRPAIIPADPRKPHLRPVYPPLGTTKPPVAITRHPDLKSLKRAVGPAHFATSGLPTLLTSPTIAHALALIQAVLLGFNQVITVDPADHLNATVQATISSNLVISPLSAPDFKNPQNPKDPNHPQDLETPAPSRPQETIDGRN